MLNIEEIQNIFQQVREKISCPKCGYRYSFFDTQLIRSSGNVYFLRLTCQKHHPVIVSVVFVSTKSMKKYDEKITPNQLLDGYKKIKSAKNLKQLLK
ncbi:MAG: hypothetical protein NTW79_04095 [Candidatus Berkelbacteria bacterium]|nr:hypothetical protein [Candidatus Berkelbacteria bacterium]